jgi:methylenetetrahydrofolate reductase (NADPH)
MALQMIQIQATSSLEVPERKYVYAHRYSIELSPSDVVDFNLSSAGGITPGSRIFLTHLEGRPLRAQVEAARRVVEIGYAPVAHLGARNFQNVDEFRHHITDLTSAGVKQALIVGGNPKTPYGPFSEALDLLQDSALHNAGLETVFLGSYPEGHPNISSTELARALDSKVTQCRRLNVQPRLLSQFAFDGAKLASFVQDLHGRYPDIPVHLGVAGVTSLPKLIRFAMKCGVGPSLSVLRKSGASGLLNIIETQTPDDLLSEFEHSYSKDRPPIFLHFFPFGGWRKTADWILDHGRGYMPPE